MKFQELMNLMARTEDKMLDLSPEDMEKLAESHDFDVLHLSNQLSELRSILNIWGKEDEPQTKYLDNLSVRLMRGPIDDEGID